MNRVPERRSAAGAQSFFFLALLLVALLLAWASWAALRHRETVTATLEDYAYLAARRYAQGLNETFQRLYNEGIYVAAGLHRKQEWARSAEPATPTGTTFPRGAVRAYVSVDLAEGSVSTHRGTLPPGDWEEWIVATVDHHVRTVYLQMRHIPYAGAPRVTSSGFFELVYRMETFDEDPSPQVFGFLVEMDRFGDVFERILRTTELLPGRAGLRVDDAASVLTVELLPPPGADRVFWRSAASFPSAVTGREAGAGRAGRTRIRVGVDPASADLLVEGGLPRASPTAILVLSLLALTLLGMSYLQMRRERRLSQMREAFVANVSHELRTPLTQIRMFTESLLLDRLPSEADRRRSLEVVHREARRLAALVENVLALSTASRSQRTVSEPVDAVAQAREAVEAMRPLVREREAEVVVEGDAYGVADLDLGVFRRSLANLLDNALEYGPAGQTVRVTVLHEDGELVLEVADRGPGIPAGKREAVWERFTRLDHGASSTGGTGIGLAVVREIVEDAGGSVSIRDGGDGTGAVFRISLPVGGGPA